MSYPALRLRAAGLAIIATLDCGRVYPGAPDLTYQPAVPAVLTQRSSSHRTRGSTPRAPPGCKRRGRHPESGGYGNCVCIDNTPVIRTCYARDGACWRRRASAGYKQEFDLAETECPVPQIGSIEP